MSTVPLPPVRMASPQSRKASASRGIQRPPLALILPEASPNQPCFPCLSSSPTKEEDDLRADPALGACPAELYSRTAVPTSEKVLQNPLKIIPWVPSKATAEKYERTVRYSADPFESEVGDIQPFEMDFEDAPLPPGWTIHVCPEGKRHFRDASRSLLTTTDIYDPTNMRRIEEASETILSRLQARRVPEDTDIVLGLTKSDDDEQAISYYFASMSKEAVFWYEPVEPGLVTEYERRVVSKKHLALAVKAQFWQHMELFPNHRGLPKACIKELKDVFSHGLCDYITSRSSMFPYDNDTNTFFAKCLSKIEEDEPNKYNTWVAARLWNTVYRERYMQFYGEPGVRMDRLDSAFNDSSRRPRSIAFNILSPFLFFMPYVYMKELDNLYVDHTVHYYFWRQFITGLKRDWENSITPATVLLSANVGFLAIQSIDNPSPNRSAAQITSYISAVLSLFVYIVCQILARHHRHDAHGQADMALEYIIKREDRLIGLQAVAIAFSLPTALFLWSMITFLGAMMVVFFENTSTATRVSIGAVLVILGAMVVLLLYLERENTITGDFMRIFRLYDTSVRETWQSWKSAFAAKAKPSRLWRRVRGTPEKRNSMASTATCISMEGP